LKISLIHNYNPLGAVLMVIIFLIIMGLLTFVLFFYDFTNLGIPGVAYKVDEVYALEKFEFKTDYIEFSLKDKGYLIPGYRNNSVYGVVIIGDGDFLLKHPTEKLKGNFTSLFIPMHPEEYQVFREKLILTRVYDSKIIKKGEKTFNKGLQAFFHYKLFGNERFYFKPLNTFMASMETEKFGYAHYTEGDTVTFTSEKKDTTEMDNPLSASEYPPSGTIPFSVMVIGLYTALLMGTVYILTVDLPFKAFWTKNRIQADPREAFVLIISFAIYLLFAVIDLKSSLHFTTYLKPVMVMGISLITCSFYKYDFNRIGLNTTHVSRGLLIGFVLALLGFFLSAMSIPKTIHPPFWKALLIPIFQITQQELYFRGIIQTYLEYIVKPIWSIVITPCIHSLLYVIPLLFIHQNPGLSALFHGLVIIPATGLVVSFMYYKLKSIFPGIIFMVTLLVLSNIVVF